ncbi:ABC transporter permease subunit [Anaerocolumna sedimenticola]|uniref:ABC transporter permease subunit n=1 Tax=Anaerocolumna sedimenticola TaxID=2696063 RepID=A0A6P1TMR5_9FIRM|nr:carbohydrate ABC transporter permease [Anaerocolumna sedimenticola]QHQ60628.1 ABC transporter permease subunit [Anaerocolumna sedimenticola]
MKIKRSKGEIVFSGFNYFILAFIMLICLYPVVYVAVASVSDSNLLTQHSGILLKPLGFSLDSYKKVFQNPMILKGYANTLFILIIGIFLDILMTSIGAYFLSRKGVLLKKPVMLLIIFTMFFSGGMIPFYLTLKDLHMTNTLWGLIIPFMVNTYNLIILRTSFESIPDSLVEAAEMDGAGHIRILFSIILPLSKAILAVMVLYYGVGIWNGWFWASTIIRKRELYPLQVILREILMQNDVGSMTAGVSAADQESVGMTIKYATIVVATVPILCIYPFLQKYFTKGVLIGAVKE